MSVRDYAALRDRIDILEVRMGIVEDDLCLDAEEPEDIGGEISTSISYNAGEDQSEIDYERGVCDAYHSASAVHESLENLLSILPDQYSDQLQGLHEAVYHVRRTLIAVESDYKDLA